MGVIRTCIRNRRNGTADSTRQRQTTVDEAIGVLLLWFRLRVRHLQIASFLRRSVGTRSLALALRIAATLLGCLAGKELLARQTPANRQYSGDQNCNNRFVREERHLLPLLYRGRVGMNGRTGLMTGTDKAFLFIPRFDVSCSIADRGHPGHLLMSDAALVFARDRGLSKQLGIAHPCLRRTRRQLCYTSSLSLQSRCSITAVYTAIVSRVARCSCCGHTRSVHHSRSFQFKRVSSPFRYESFGGI